METTSPKNHVGRKIAKIRELRGMKQEALAQAMGVSQQTVSLLENSEEVDDKRLKDVAEALGVSLEAIENFNEENLISYFNNFHDNSVNQGPMGSHNVCNFNPLDKVVELYERMLEMERQLTVVEREKVGYLERLLGR